MGIFATALRGSSLRDSALIGATQRNGFHRSFDYGAARRCAPHRSAAPHGASCLSTAQRNATFSWIIPSQRAATRLDVSQLDVAHRIATQRADFIGHCFTAPHGSARRATSQLAAPRFVASQRFAAPLHSAPRRATQRISLGRFHRRCSAARRFAPRRSALLRHATLRDEYFGSFLATTHLSAMPRLAAHSAAPRHRAARHSATRRLASQRSSSQRNFAQRPASRRAVTRLDALLRDAAHGCATPRDDTMGHIGHAAPPCCASYGSTTRRYATRCSAPRRGATRCSALRRGPTQGNFLCL